MGIKIEKIKKTKNIFNKKVIFFIILFLSFNQAYAVPPPDFIIQIVSNLGTYFAISIAFLSSIFLGIKTNLQIYFGHLGKVKVVIIFILFILGISFIGAYYYDNYEQEKEISRIKKELSLNKINSKKIEKKDVIIENIEENTDKIIKQTYFKTEEINFLYKYYKNINDKRLLEAYNIGTKNTSFSVFNSWYKNIDYLKVNSIKPISGTTKGYKIDLYISENGEIINYIVFKYLGVGKKGELKIIKTKTTKKIIVLENDLIDLTISNSEFNKIYKSDKNIIILDAREDLEVEIGRIPGSKHIRFSELRYGEYKTLDKNKIIYVYCWSGIRGKEVALFLKSKGLNVIFLVDGAKGWYDFGGKWEGEINFSNYFDKTNYKKIFMKDSLQKELKKGIILVDIRETKKFNKSSLAKSINVPLVNLSKKDWKNYIDKIPQNSKIITVCDDYVNCFYAKIVGIELEKRGFSFEGRYSLAYN